MTEVTTSVDMLNPAEKILGKLNLSNVVIPSVKITDIIDIILVAIIVYTIIHWVQETRAWTLFKGLLIIIAVSFLSYYLHFYTLTWIIEKTLSVGIIALIIIFQPELRKALEQIGAGSINSVTGIFQAETESGTLTSKSADEILTACERMSAVKTGALIVIEKNIPMVDITGSSGVVLNAEISNQLLINIFENKTPLHDGAVIIRDNIIVSASCILPVTKSEIGQELGTRHRAAVGVSEISDALVVVVSEETGAISLAHNGKLTKNISEAKFKQELYALVEKDVQTPINLNKIWKGMKKNARKK